MLLSDMLILGSFILLHVGALELSGRKNLFPRLGVALLASQVVAFAAMTSIHPHPAMRIALIGALVSIQVCETILLLLRGAKDRARMPMYFCATILTGFIAVNIFRSLAVLFIPRFQRQPYAGDLVTISFVVFITVALGIAFGFFWMTTAELSAELEKMASTDPLTRIYNRRVFREWCEREIDKSRRKGSTFSLLMMDLDHFKQINDRFGHIGGDEMLIGVVEKMQDSVRGIDILGRWGGEEFVALLPGASQDAALIVAQRVRINIEKLLMKRPEGASKQGGEPMRLTVSVGVATYRGKADQLEDIFQRADTALYRAKEGGRNQALWMA
ncbi:GGDEF domain-containing protein [Granulicella sibirica]|uniref:diguanylate cyclase n=1 Tax=Granulicella sibirica TaxID=2479048 RepID=A0A4Q0SXR1_9BACT|nr:GGDEF domain-containing protein [Granulicella sibirica]RXH55943.1 hypothetical protein GRAN_2800 [Granulicella sibirica]